MAKKALFLDRDGVINIDKGYIYKIDEFIFVDGIFSLCKRFKDHLIFIVTNQSGIARGYYSENDFSILSSYMIDEFIENGIIIDKIYHCPHYPHVTGECECRKPKDGMIKKACGEFSVDIQNSTLIGDKPTDVECGAKAGIKNLFLLNANKDIKNTQNLHGVKIVHSLKEIQNLNMS